MVGILIYDFANTGIYFGQYRQTIWPITVNDDANTVEGTFSKVLVLELCLGTGIKRKKKRFCNRSIPLRTMQERSPSKTSTFRKFKFLVIKNESRECPTPRQRTFCVWRQNVWFAFHEKEKKISILIFVIEILQYIHCYCCCFVDFQ